MDFKVVERFVSINGEGRCCGQLAIFIRFAGCNLNCSYCDTLWANEKDVSYEVLSSKDIYEYVKSKEVKNVTLTGGEPLLQKGIMELLKLLSKDKELYVEIETNGSILLDEFLNIENSPSFTMDYKLPLSNMENKMALDNFKYLTKKDTVKFVSGSIEDLEKAREIINKYNLVDKTNVYISPVFGKINLDTIVEFMKNNRMNGVNLQLQLHKIIWEPSKRGV
ncbi:putative 7-carboxy-7-deazaguanine synthase QueE [Clostridium botulinum]|uniref:7-carboxy-7-deazaguanine synthase n=1 Tax=Clostridium botulinum CFSAN001627 TaxID=1232189 RepID=M1ZUK8_CLOBO|nr:putative 7-carboxy-7-deazaguanine synthase QueE [Clostridium botulinum]EKN43106.1 radical SAM domain-containing protein [Clostridium botulinum CFSAN001627]APC79332.1 putative 7-cyano-7-deazaguanosine (preQ0) biosynthesis protein QueE [Clostridium botulinum]APC84998.1 putative 7-cyano-7-deazaguanosine (preQ0) biosynthesis protein QueE [Clostridium botulinum]AXG95055.1 putative 7-carboxy-7-deazaguanine synthase QueE [Clostridium botulinum]EDT80987.1 radical SAM domain protein [Clostridium bot